MAGCGIITGQFKILELEVVDVFHRRIQFHLRQRTRIARELQLRLLDVVLVKMQIAEGVDEVAGLQAANLRDHQREQRVAGDVERHAEENIRAALVKLAAQFAVADVKLEQRVARRQRHLSDFTRIPRADDVPPAVGILFDLLDDLVNLIEGASVGRAPVAPLRAIDAAQAAVLVRPFVPNRHAVLVEIFDVGVAAQEPEQFVNDGFGMDFLGREQREIVSQVKPRLSAKHGIRAGARAVGLELAVFEDVPQQIEVLNHRGENLTTKDTKDEKNFGRLKDARRRFSPGVFFKLLHEIVSIATDGMPPRWGWVLFCVRHLQRYRAYGVGFRLVLEPGALCRVLRMKLSRRAIFGSSLRDGIPGKT